MSRRVNRIPVILDTGNIKELSQEDIKMILRAADMCIMKAGRNMLAKILKGSKDKKLFELKLDECPAYGYYHDMKLADIMHYIDWMIDEDYLRIKYDGRLPLLVFSDEGWEIEKETFAQELYQQFCLDVKENNPRVIHKLIKVNRKVILRILDIIEEEGNKEFIPCLEAYKKIETKRIGRRIIEVEKTIKDKVKKVAGKKYKMYIALSLFLLKHISAFKKLNFYLLYSILKIILHRCSLIICIYNIL